MTALNTIQTVPLTIWEDGTIRVKETRLPIDRIIYAHRQGECPEAIFESFPSKEYTVADIYLIVAFYLQNKTEIDKYLTRREKEAEKIRKKIESAPGYQESRDELRKKLLARWKEKEK